MEKGRIKSKSSFEWNRMKKNGGMLGEVEWSRIK